MNNRNSGFFSSRSQQVSGGGYTSSSSQQVSGSGYSSGSQPVGHGSGYSSSGSQHVSHAGGYSSTGSHANGGYHSSGGHHHGSTSTQQISHSQTPVNMFFEAPYSPGHGRTPYIVRDDTPGCCGFLCR